MAQFQNAHQQMSNCLFHHSLSCFRVVVKYIPLFFLHLVKGSIN